MANIDEVDALLEGKIPLTAPLPPPHMPPPPPPAAATENENENHNNSHNHSTAEAQLNSEQTHNDEQRGRSKSAEHTAEDAADTNDNHRSSSRHRSRSRSPPRERGERSSRHRSRSRSPDYRRDRDRRRDSHYDRDGDRGYDRYDQYDRYDRHDRYDRRRESSRRDNDRPIERRYRSPSPTQQRERSPIVIETSVDRDQRTVVCMQLARRCTERQLKDFLEQNTGGRIVSCRMILDRTNKPKGIAYAEFATFESVPKALALSSQRLLGAPIMVMVTQAEKNRQAEEKARLEREALTKLSVTNLPLSLKEDEHLGIAFEPFGRMRECKIVKTPDGRPTGEGFVVYEVPSDAQKALEVMNNKAFLGAVLRVSLAAQGGSGGGAAGLHPVLDDDAVERGGVHMTAELRQRLAERAKSVLESGPTPMVVPTISPTGAPVVATTSCLVLRNMFNPATETEPDWDVELRNEILEEITKHGTVVFIHVDKTAVDGSVFIKFAQEAGAIKVQAVMNGRFFDGRQIQALFMPLTVFYARFPESVNAVRPLKPS